MKNPKDLFIKSVDEIKNDFNKVQDKITALLNNDLKADVVKTNDNEQSRLNPKTQILTQSDPDEVKIRNWSENKYNGNTKNKNQPL